MEGGIRAVHAEVERVMNINNEDHLAGVRTFATDTYPKLTGTDSGKHPRQAFECCLAFCTEKAIIPAKTHDPHTQLSFSKFMKKYRFDDADTFGQALIDILKKKANEGRTIVFPSFNEVHSRLVEETETILRLKEQLRQKDREIIELKTEQKFELQLKEVHKQLYESVKGKATEFSALADDFERAYLEMKGEYIAFKGFVDMDGCTFCHGKLVKFRNERIISNAKKRILARRTSSSHR